MNRNSEKRNAHVLVLKSGLFETIQDQGRTGYQAYGVARSGSMDMYAYQLGNVLLGNARFCPSMEITLSGPTLRFTEPTAIVLTGATLEPTINGRRIATWKVIPIEKDDVLTIGPVTAGCRAYLAIKGGFRVPNVMGSASTYVKGEVGGWYGRALQSGDEIPYALDEVADRGRSSCVALAHSLRPQYGKHTVIRVILGPQEKYFSKHGMATFLQETYHVTAQMDRMGIRLEGPAIEHVDSADILSDSIPFGGIQVPANGQPIILMADRQTTGGYPKIATVITADLPKVAQLRPQQTIQFQAVPVEEAQRLYRQQENMLRRLELLLKRAEEFM